MSMPVQVTSKSDIPETSAERSLMAYRAKATEGTSSHFIRLPKNAAAPKFCGPQRREMLDFTGLVAIQLDEDS